MSSLQVLWSSSLVLVLLRLPEALTVQRLPRHLHYGLHLRIHVKDAFLAAFLTLRHKYRSNIIHLYLKTVSKLVLN